MSTPREEKLKTILKAVPPGFLVDSHWMNEHAVSRSSVRDYLARGWLERLERGVYRRPAPDSAPESNTIDWQTCLLSVQNIMAYRVHVGGMTALSLRGYSHYLALGGRDTVWVYATDVPPWLTKVRLNGEIITRRPSLFDDTELGVSTDHAAPGGRSSSLPWGWTLKMSEPERAVMEALDELPGHESFHNLDKVFEGLVNLRPRRLNRLLKHCRKIKVKRLFFVFADRHDHGWRKHLKADDFELGSGDRALVEGGRMHPRYRIMVPTDFIGKAEEARDGA